VNNDKTPRNENLENLTNVLPPPSAVGFGKPPESTRFRKGVSGNPKGRPKGSLNIANVLMRILREKVVINEHGQRRTITKLEAAFKQLLNKAAAGDLRAISQLSDLARETEEKQGTAAAEQRSVVDDLDQQVIQGILKRFQQKDDEAPQSEIRQTEEVQDGYDQ
jgi:hypothetical protein